jgi:hypothetical protein
MPDTFLTISTIIANTALTAGVVVAVVQLSGLRASNQLQREVFLADHERRKKQATIEFTHRVLEERRAVSGLITNAFGADHINPGDPRYSENPELKSAVLRYLNLMERISVGINIGVYDLHTFSRITGRATSRFFRRLTPIIESRRLETGAPTLYRDFEVMTKAIDADRDQYLASLPDLAKIQHS